MPSREVVILADPNSKGYGFARKVFGNIFNRPNRDFPVEFVDIDIKTFRDGEKKIRIRENIRRRICFFIHDSNKNPDAWFTELVLINEALKFAAAGRVIDVIPYLRFARQDRKDRSRVSLSSRVVADCISLYTDRAITVDVHALQIQGFYKIPFDTLYSFPQVVDYFIEHHADFLQNLVIMSPDAGGAPRAGSFKNKLAFQGIESDLAIGYKHRITEGEIEEYKVLGDVKVASW